jgi:preprotein translocase subunit YajC
MINPAWAQAGADAPSPIVNLLPLLLIFVVFYFLLIRPQQTRAKEQSQMLANLKRNDDVITSGGLYGKIIALSERVVTLEIAPKVQVKVDRQQIASLVKTTQQETKEKEKEKEQSK